MLKAYDLGYTLFHKSDLVRSLYCRWRISKYRRLQRKYFGQPIANNQKPQIIWENNLDHEVDFWQSSLVAGQFDDRLTKDFTPSPELASLLEKLESRKKIEILDVGSGPLSSVPRQFRSLEIELTLADPLANTYEGLLKKLNVSRDWWPMVCDGEKLRETFADQRFDVVQMRNALDHCYDPVLVIKEMAALVKPGGHLFLEHFENEAEKEGYEGLHQWNLFEENGDLCIANRTIKHSIKDLLGNEFKVHAYPVYRHGGFVVLDAEKAP